MDLLENSNNIEPTVQADNDASFAPRVLNKLKAHKAAIGAGFAAVVGTAALILATNSAAALTSLNVTDPSYPEGTTVLADASTVDSYKLYPTGDIATSYDTTEFAGRLWADKTVYAPDDGYGNLGSTVTLDLADTNRDLDTGDNGAVPAGKFEVDKTESGTFLTSISLLSSSIETEMYEPTPLDIVLVLDVSGSMGEDGYTVYNPYTEEQLEAITQGSNSLGNNTFFLNKSGGYTAKAGWEGYIWISKNPDGSDAQKVPYLDKGGDLYILIRNDSVVTDRDRLGDLEYWYWSKTENGTYSTTAYNFMYTLLYKKGTRHKIDDLHDAVSEFVTTIAQNNTDLASSGFGAEYMSTIGVVKFSGKYSNRTYDTPAYKIASDTSYNNGQTEILAPLKVYTNEGSGETEAIDGIRTKLESLTPNGGTAADCALTLAKGVFDGEAYYTNANNKEPGARSGVQKVVVFFTDGNPKKDRGKAPRDFSGLVAQETLAAAKDLKDEGVIIYSVAVLQGADPSDTTMNANIYLNGVSSNYPDAKATNGVDIPSEGYVYDEATGTFTDLGPASDPKYLVYGTNYSNPGLDATLYKPSYLSWEPDLGERAEAYSLTLDTSVQPGKSYYVRSGTGTALDPYKYTAVTNPSNANISRYYEQTNYYLAVDGDMSISDAFMKILGEITQGGGGDSAATGRDGNTAVTIVDYLGDYMEFKGIDGILFGTEGSTTTFYAPGTQGAYHEQAQAQRDDRSATESVYTMSASVPSALLNSSAGSNLNNITIQVTRSTDPKVGDTVTIKVPPELIPSLRYSVKQQLSQGSGSVLATTVTRSTVDPLRIFYSVGPKATTLSNVISQLEDQALCDPNAINESDNQTTAYRDFVSSAAADGRDNVYPLYNNLIPTSSNPSYNNPTADGENPAAGTTVVTMTLSPDNPYYFYQDDEDLYIKTGENTYERAITANYEADATQLYVKHRVWTVGESDATETYVEWNGTPALNTVNNTYYIPAGTPKTTTGDYTSVELAKDGNYTNTAKNYTVCVFTGTDRDANNNYLATMYLGNNGELDIPVYGTLAVSKDFTAETGYNLPENATATFTLTLKSKDGQTLTDSYPAIIRDNQGHPIDPTTHAIVSTSEAARFTIKSGDSFTLRDNETLRVTGLPNNSTYQVTEAAAQGYQATVTNNNNSTNEFPRGAESSTTAASNG